MATQTGYLVLADISGFTSYLAATELDHAHEILGELIELIVSKLSALLTLSKLEGDAAFMYAPATKVTRGETLLELIEATYVAFRDRQTGMHRRTTCTCNACRNIPALDLKFMAHHGEFVLQSVVGREEVIGSDVNLAHRLMKNHISETTGWRAYALFTQKCLEAMGVQPAGWHPQVETYEHLGEVPTRSVDLRARYKELVEARRQVLTAEDADLTFSVEVAAPPAVVWDWLNDPHKRNQWMFERHWSVGARPQGRMSAGARNHCAHGKSTLTETVLDWRPFDYFTRDQDDGRIHFLETTTLTPTDNQRTRVTLTIKFDMRLPNPFRRPLLRFITTRIVKYDAMYHNLAHLIEQQQAQPKEN
jgi:uncharacterized protein YndB with AHSA1/START domain